MRDDFSWRLLIFVILATVFGPCIRSNTASKCHICGHKDYPRDNVTGMTESFVICRKCAQDIYDRYKTKEQAK